MLSRNSRLRACVCGIALTLALPAVAPAVTAQPGGLQAPPPPPAPTPPVGPAAPLVNTGGVKNRTAVSGTLSGWVNAGAQSTTYHFEYGPTTAYGSSTPPGTVAGSRKTPVIADITGLMTGAIYHYRLVAQNATGVAQGLDKTFKAIAAPVPPPVPPGPPPAPPAPPAPPTPPAPPGP
jgi:hypothetical protein